VGWALYYYFACESGGGQTVGKRLTRLRVVREDGSPAEMREIAVRTVLRLVDTALVGLIAMLATGERRGRVGDLAAGTMIVSTEATPGVAPAVAAPAASEAPAEEEPGSHDEELPKVVDDEPARAYEPITREDPADEAESVAELAPDVEPAPLPRPVAEVEIAGPEIDVEEPRVTVRSVDTVSAIDLVMGADEPTEDRPPAGDPPTVA
jgi:RDD family